MAEARAGGDDVGMNEWVGRPAAEIAAAVRSGQVTAAEVIGGHLDRIAQVNPELGAFVRVRSAEAAREAAEVDARADRADLPLAGVPVAIKDSVPVAGEPMRFGSAAAPGGAQEKDHPVVARLREAGAVVVGLTNLPELSIYPFTDSAFGIARNPWDRRRTAGGSSGGSAAAVASAMVPLAHGTDGLGSIRIPAAACGLFGIKPGAGLVPAQVGTDSWGGLMENGPLATTVADAALMLEVMAGATFDLAERAHLRIAVSVKPPGPGIVVHRACKAPVRQDAELLAGLGHTVEADDPAYPPWATPVMIANWFAAPAADAALGRTVVAAQRGHLPQVRPDDRSMEHGWLPGRQRARSTRSRGTAGLRPARGGPGGRIGAAGAGRTARTRPRLAQARARLRPV